jgi:DNA-binding transcriptional MerR regulator
MNKQHYLLNEIAKILGVKAHRLSYALSNGYLPEPAERINNKRLFSPEDLRVAASYFAAQPQGGGRRAKA